MNEEYTTPPAGELMARIACNSQDVWRDYAEIRFAIRDSNGVIWHAMPMEFVKTEDLGQAQPAGVIVCLKSPEGERLMRSIMDQLWAMGVRPTDMGSPSHVASVERHLQDMRTLLGHTMQVQLPGGKSK